MDDKKVVRVNRISWLAGLFLVLALNPLPGVAEERVLDISNLDPYLWQKIEAELSEREQSRERIGYYALGKEILEFRVVLDVPIEEKVADSEWMVTSDDERLLVSKNAAIGSDDIYGILIEKTTYRGITQYDITLYFKQESFDKIRDISRQHEVRCTLKIQPEISSCLDYKVSTQLLDGQIRNTIEGHPSQY